MSESFKQADVFPLIYRFITDRSDRDSAFVGHSALVDALLADAEGGKIIAAAEVHNKLGKLGTAANMVAWFSQRYTINKNAFADLLERQKIGNTWAYRSKQLTPTATSPNTFSLDVDASAIEGHPQLVTHIKRERKPELVAAKLAAMIEETGRLTCECCGFEPTKKFPGIDYPIVEVHHRTMLSDHEGATTTSLDDLSVLCPTCHRAIHRSDGLSVEEFRVTFFAAP